MHVVLVMNVTVSSTCALTHSLSSILKVLCRGLCLEDGFNFSLVAEKSPGFVGADLSSLVTEAALCAVNRSLPPPSLSFFLSLSFSLPPSLSSY